LTSVPPLRRTSRPNLAVCGAPTKSIEARAPPPVSSITLATASGSPLSIVANAPAWRAMPRFCGSTSATISFAGTTEGAMCRPLSPTPPAPISTRWSSSVRSATFLMAE
jgi:hypothetical protein